MSAFAEFEVYWNVAEWMIAKATEEGWPAFQGRARHAAQQESLHSLRWSKLYAANMRGRQTRGTADASQARGLFLKGVCSGGHYDDRPCQKYRW